MMLKLIKKNPSSPFFSFFHKTIPISNLFHFCFSSASQDQNPSPKSNFITEYLITSCGFSPRKADTTSKYITYITSPLKPDSVLHFLKHHGFTATDIRTIISGYPFILNADVDQTIGSNLQALSRLGFTEHELQKLIVCNPQALLLRSAIPRIEFWRTLLNCDMKNLLAAFTRNRRLINFDIDTNVIPKITLMKDYGLSGTQIGMIVRLGRCFGRSTTSMKMLLMRVEELGFPRGSSMFVYGLLALSCMSPLTFKTKVELFKSLGWTEEEFATALNRYPYILRLSEENIRDKLKFLMERAGCTQSYIVFRPTLLSYSMEKRLTPRLHVVEILKSNESVRTKLDLFSIMSYPEKIFIEKIVIRHKEVVPKLHEAYVAACKGCIENRE